MEIVSFVILHYKDWKVTERCIRSILQMDDPMQRIRIVVVDNDIGRKREKRKQFQAPYSDDDRIAMIFIEENGGFSYANNKGYQYAREKQRASYIIVLNNDIEFPQRDFLDRLDKSYQKHPCHILGPDVIRKSTGEHQNPMDTRLRTREEAEFTVRMNHLALKLYPVVYPLLYWKFQRDEKKKIRQKRKNEAYYLADQEDIILFGACLIFFPDFVNQEALAFTPETNFFYEEYILANRCRKKSYGTVYDPALKVYHESGAATKTTFGSERKRMRFMLERTAEAAEVYLELLEGKK